VKGFVAERGGTLVPSGDALRVADAIVSWPESAERRTEAGAFNRRLVLERYSWRASAAALLGVYERVLRGERKPERRTA
jgi:glycosyltransferase involved in cell wall biosynthesis